MHETLLLLTHGFGISCIYFWIIKKLYMYSQTCLKRLLKGLKKMRSLNTGGLHIHVLLRTGSTVLYKSFLLLTCLATVSVCHIIIDNPFIG